MGSVCTASFLGLSMFFLIVIQQKILDFRGRRNRGSSCSAAFAVLSKEMNLLSSLQIAKVRNLILVA